MTKPAKINSLEARSAIILFAVVLFFLSVINAFSQEPADSLSLEMALKQAFSASENLLADRANCRAAEYNIKTARAAYMPSLTLSSSYSHLSKVGEIFFTIPGTSFSRTIKIGSENPFSTGINLYYDLYTFGRRSASVQLAKTGARRAELKYQNARKSFFDSVVRAYFAVVYAGEGLELIRQEKTRFEQIYRLVGKRFEQELVSEFDLLQTELRLETYDLALLEMSNNLQTARLNLADLLHTPENQLPALSEKIDSDILSCPEFIDTSVLYTSREDYIELNLAVRNAQLTKKINRSAYFPSLSAFGGYEWRNGYPEDVDKIEDNFAFGVKLNWLLFDGFSRSAELSKQDYYIRANNYLLDDIRQEIPKQVENIRLQLQNNKARLEVSIRALHVAEKSMAIARTRFDIGDLTMIEFLEIENKLSQAELDLLRLKYERILIQLDYKRICGYYPELDDLD